MNGPENAATQCRVSIIIKALNEEKRVVAAVESALAAVRAIGGEVVLADSCSTDRTVALASAHPIRIVQLAHASERCCGVGPQLGYQHSLGEFVYILDGDMEMLPGFLPQALAFMQTHPEVAGVGGRVVEMNTSSLEYLARVERGTGHMQAGEVDRLDMGGLYRRAAIEQAGYFSDRNLHSYEEFDLAVRLRVNGWKLWRLATDSVRHHGHDAPPYQLLVRRWRSRYICGLGEVVRAAWGRPHMRLVLTGVRELRLYAGVLAWWVVLAGCWLVPAALPQRAGAFLFIALAPVLLMAWRKRSLRKAVFSVVSWCFNAAGLVRGLFAPQRPARAAVASVQIRDKPDTANAPKRAVAL
jgi:glycosyltransferase involved in cell wall biosynthesis